eukprot:1029855-Prymnesium_polylepis.2
MALSSQQRGLLALKPTQPARPSCRCFRHAFHRRLLARLLRAHGVRAPGRLAHRGAGDGFRQGMAHPGGGRARRRRARLLAAPGRVRGASTRFTAPATTAAVATA